MASISEQEVIISGCFVSQSWGLYGDVIDPVYLSPDLLHLSASWQGILESDILSSYIIHGSINLPYMTLQYYSDLVRTPHVRYFFDATDGARGFASYDSQSDTLSISWYEEDSGHRQYL